MKWFKHLSNMRHDPIIKKLIRSFGAEGYAVYNYILESIAGNLSSKSPYPDLEEDFEDIAFDLNMKENSVENIVKFCIDKHLFLNCAKDKDQIKIACPKIYKFLDDSTRKSPEIAKMLKLFDKLQEPEKVRKKPRESEKVLPDIELDIELDIEEEGEKNPLKQKFEDHVYLTGKQHSKLIYDYGESIAVKSILDLDNYITNNKKGAKYKDHNKTIRAWLRKDGVLPKKEKKILKCPKCGEIVDETELYCCNCFTPIEEIIKLNS